MQISAGNRHATRAADLLLLIEGATARVAISDGGQAKAARAKRIAEKLLMAC